MIGNTNLEEDNFQVPQISPYLQSLLIAVDHKQ
jgi:hypothetical protein